MITETKWNIVNAGIAGLLVLLGAFSATEELTFRAFYIAVFTSLLVAVSKFKDYWETEEKKNITPLFSFLP